jgi:outer membrane biogenesis lipoprotein LolB
MSAKRVAVVAALLLTGCVRGDRPVQLETLYSNDWTCTTSHVHTWTSFVLVGKVMVPQTHTRTICDQYTRKENAP